MLFAADAMVQYSASDARDRGQGRGLQAARAGWWEARFALM
jgi:hypothetical protein